MELSIIIPTFNRFNSLKNSLQSIYENIVPNIELIVIDQSPDADKSKKYFEEKYKDITYITTDKQNLPNARNIGIKISSGDILLFLDDDIIMHKGCINSHLKFHKNHSTPLHAGRTIQSGDIQWAPIDELARIDLSTAETAANFDNKLFHHNIPFAVGCHFSIKRDVIRTVGFFDMAYSNNSLYEDLDFSFRLRKKGFKIDFNPEAIIEHKTESSGGCRHEKDKEYLLKMLHNRTLFYLKNIRIIPSIKFIIYLKHLTEYICRIKKGHYSIHLLLKVIYNLLTAYFHCITSSSRTRTFRQCK